MARIDQFLCLELVCNLLPVVPAAGELQSRYSNYHYHFNLLKIQAEMLPPGPKWRAKPLQMTHPTKIPVTLYYCDPIECLQSLLYSPLLRDDIKYAPYQLFKTAEELTHVHTEWLSSDDAWEMQVTFYI